MLNRLVISGFAKVLNENVTPIVMLKTKMKNLQRALQVYFCTAIYFIPVTIFYASRGFISSAYSMVLGITVLKINSDMVSLQISNLQNC